MPTHYTSFRLRESNHCTHDHPGQRSGWERAYGWNGGSGEGEPSGRADQRHVEHYSKARFTAQSGFTCARQAGRDHSGQCFFRLAGRSGFTCAKPADQCYFHSILVLRLRSKHIRYPRGPQPSPHSPITRSFLRIDTGSHSSRIRQLLVTPDNKTLISAGDDKTIRVWDIETKTEVRRLLGQIGSGDYGNIQAIALSPGGDYVVVLVWLNPEGTHESHDRETDVRVYELATGNLQAGFRFPGELQDLDFSPDGNYIAMVGNPKGTVRRGYVQVYDTQGYLDGI